MEMTNQAVEQINIALQQANQKVESYGQCKVTSDCINGYFCDLRNPQFPTGDLTDPYGICRLITNTNNGSDDGTISTTITPSVPQPTPIPVPNVKNKYCGFDIINDPDASTVDENGVAIQSRNYYRGYYANAAAAAGQLVQNRKFDIICVDFKLCGGSNVDCFQFEDQWRDCRTRRIRRDDIPTTYVQIKFQNGTTCWEETPPLEFSPDLGKALLFKYQRGAGSVTPSNIKVFNPSGARVYRLSFRTNEEITFTPSSVSVGPKQTESFSVSISPSLLEKIGDGTAQIDLEIIVDEIK